MAKFSVFSILFLAASLVQSISGCNLCGNKLSYNPYIAPGGCGLGYGAYPSLGLGLGKNLGLGLNSYAGFGQGIANYPCPCPTPCLRGPVGLPPIEGCALDAAKICLAQKLLCFKRKLLAKKLGVCGNLFV